MSKLVGLVSLVLLLVLFLGINLTADRTLSGVRLDLTEGRLYTIQPATRRIAKSPEEPITLRFYYSKDLARGIPQIETRGRRVKELLEAIVASSGGKITLERINPEPFSEAEDEAVAEGLSPTPITPTENLYFGLVATNTLDGREVIPDLRAGDERFLEYRVAQIIAKLAEPDKPTVGLITGLEMSGGFDPRLQRPRPEWAILRELRTTFEIEPIEQDAGEIPDSVDLLLIVHPKGVTPATEYAIDQYVLGGGRAVIFVDPFAEADQSQQQMGMMQVGQDKSSTLPNLFQAWGLEMDTGQVVGDTSLAMRVLLPGPRQEAVPYIIWLLTGGEQLADDDPVTGNLSAIRFGTVGALSLADGASVTMEPLIETTEQSAMIAVEKIQFMPDPKSLLNEFFPDGQKRVLAARISGRPPSAFPDGPPEPGAESEPDAEPAPSGAGEVGDPATPDDPARLTEAAGEINVVVVADADMLEDGAWVREIRVGPAVLGYDIVADNGAFALNTVEQMAGSKDLLALRGRGEYSRPFTMLEEMRREAETEFLALEQTLQEKIEQTRQRINDLQMARTDTGTLDSLVLTPEQQQEIEELSATLLEDRKQLREVQLNLRKDIESLETRLKLINTALVPALLCVFALGLGGYRAVRRRADRRRGSLG